MQNLCAQSSVRFIFNIQSIIRVRVFQVSISSHKFHEKRTIGLGTVTLRSLARTNFERSSRINLKLDPLILC